MSRIHTKSNIAQSKELLFVPKQCIITNEVAASADICVKLSIAGCTLSSKQLYVAFFLLEEKNKGQNSFWYPYLQILPRYLKSIPLFYSEAELKLLSGTPFPSKIAWRKQRYERDFQEAVKLVPEIGLLTTIEDFIWARVIVQSRIFGIHMEGTKTSAMVPLADMVNHEMESNTIWAYDDRKRGFTMVSKCPIFAGNPVLDSYGTRPHSGYFLDYGMYLEEADKVVEFEFSIPGQARDEELFNRKKRLLNNRLFRMCEVTRDYDSDSTREAFGYMRVAYANPDQIARMDGDNAGRPINLKAVPALSLANEAQLLMQLADKCQKYLHGFDSTEKADWDVLDSDRPAYSVLPYNTRTCIEIRLGEKQVCQHYLKLAEKALPMIERKLTNPQALAEIQSLDLNDLSPDINFYLNHILLPLFPLSPTHPVLSAVDGELIAHFTTALNLKNEADAEKKEKGPRVERIQEGKDSAKSPEAPGESWTPHLSAQRQPSSQLVNS